MRFSGADIAISIAVLIVAFVAVFFLTGTLGLPVPQWLLAAVAAMAGVTVWFAIPRRRWA